MLERIDIINCDTNEVLYTTELSGDCRVSSSLDNNDVERHFSMILDRDILNPEAPDLENSKVLEVYSKVLDFTKTSVRVKVVYFVDNVQAIDSDEVHRAAYGITPDKKDQTNFAETLFIHHDV